MIMLRRDLLKASLAAGAALVPFGRAAFAAVTPIATPSAPRRLVVVFLRGAVDGLNVVVPYAEAGYKSARPSIGLAAPGADGGVLDLDGHFGLHPALAPLMPYWHSALLGFVHASGLQDPTRSHFDAQDYMESATPGLKTTPDGWLNRLLGALPNGRGETSAPTRAVSMGPVLPRIYAGPNAVANIALGAAATRRTLLDKPQVSSAFERLYDGDDKMARAYRESQQAHREVMQSLDANNTDSLNREMMTANNGAPLPNGFADDAARLARLMRNDGRVQLAFMALGGWDTHAAQGAATGQLANRLAPLGQGLAALAQGLGSMFDDTVIVVMSEFGRTVQENGNRGTDHGHGNVMWLLGGPVRGGKVHGAWPGVDHGALHEGRDLAVTTDFRQVLAPLVERHLRLADSALDQIFPAFREGRSGARLDLVRA